MSWIAIPLVWFIMIRAPRVLGRIQEGIGFGWIFFTFLTSFEYSVTMEHGLEAGRGRSGRALLLSTVGMEETEYRLELRWMCVKILDM